jgi:integrase
MLMNLSAPWLPPSLNGPMLVDDRGLPRFWPLAWSRLSSHNLAETTLRSRLAAIDWFYDAVRERTCRDGLDAVLTELRDESLRALLEGVQLELRNRSVEAGHDGSVKWQAILGFVRWVIDNNSRAAGTSNLRDFDRRILEMDRLFLQLRPPRKPSLHKKLRSLPTAVIEDLHELTDPASPRNPFRGDGNAHRNRAVHLLLLHQGLRRGEACLLALDSVKDGTDPQTGENDTGSTWLNGLASLPTRGRTALP